MLFVHENNIKNKIEEDYKKEGKTIKKIYEEDYLPVKEKLLSIEFGDNSECFEKATTIIEDYLKKLKYYEKKYRIDPRSKFRSSFLEEISAYLFKDNELLKEEKLGVFNKGIFTGIKLDSNRNIKLLNKDVDFCIGKKCSIEIDRTSSEEIIVPVVAVEVKTYLDGTMFGEVQYSSKLIKNSTPNAKTYVLMERNQVGHDKLMIAKYEKSLEEMFVLRKNEKSEIDKEVLRDYYNEIGKAIKEIDEEEKINIPGRIINTKTKHS